MVCRRTCRPALAPCLPQVSRVKYQIIARRELRLDGFLLSILGWSVGFERRQKPGRDSGYFVDRHLERDFIYFRRLVKPADFSNELECSRADLLDSDRRIEVKKRFDISTHHDLQSSVRSAHYVVSKRTIPACLRPISAAVFPLLLRALRSAPCASSHCTGSALPCRAKYISSVP